MQAMRGGVIRVCLGDLPGSYYVLLESLQLYIYTPMDFTTHKNLACGNHYYSHLRYKVDMLC